MTKDILGIDIEVGDTVVCVPAIIGGSNNRLLLGLVKEISSYSIVVDLLKKDVSGSLKRLVKRNLSDKQILVITKAAIKVSQNTVVTATSSGSVTSINPVPFEVKGKHVAFTGAFRSGTRTTLVRRLKAMGGYPSEYVTKDIDYLVVSNKAENTNSKYVSALKHGVFILTESQWDDIVKRELNL